MPQHRVTSATRRAGADASRSPKAWISTPSEMNGKTSTSHKRGRAFDGPKVKVLRTGSPPYWGLARWRHGRCQGPEYLTHPPRPMELLFSALESPLFPGAILALFLAVAARALTRDAQVAYSDVPRRLQPAARRQPHRVNDAPAAAPSSRSRAAASPAPERSTSPDPLSASRSLPQPHAEEEFAAAICTETLSEPLASDMPIRWL